MDDEPGGANNETRHEEKRESVKVQLVARAHEGLAGYRQPPYRDEYQEMRMEHLVVEHGPPLEWRGCGT